VARYDVYANPTVAERKHTPYFVDVQNEYIDGLSTRVMIPLRRETVFGPRARDLHPLLAVMGDAVVLDTAALGAVPVSALRAPVASLKESRASVQEALDALLGAY
jgi:toxin CcdB